MRKISDKQVLWMPKKTKFISSLNDVSRMKKKYRKYYDLFLYFWFFQLLVGYFNIIKLTTNNIENERDPDSNKG